MPLQCPYGGTCPSLPLLPEDGMNENDANGSCVVEAVLKHLEDSGIFPPDHGFMRRIAYVETRDGTNITENNDVPIEHRRVGIWGLTEFMIQNMSLQLKLHSNDTNYHQLIEYSKQIYTRFGVNLTGDEKLNLTNPLVSGIAAHFYLQYLTVLRNEKIPEDVAGQAFFWASHYGIDANTSDFKKGVMELEGMTKHNIFCDIIP